MLETSNPLLQLRNIYHQKASASRRMHGVLGPWVDMKACSMRACSVRAASKAGHKLCTLQMAAQEHAAAPRQRTRPTSAAMQTASLFSFSTGTQNILLFQLLYKLISFLWVWIFKLRWFKNLQVCVHPTYPYSWTFATHAKSSRKKKAACLQLADSLPLKHVACKLCS